MDRLLGKRNNVTERRIAFGAQPFRQPDREPPRHYRLMGMYKTSLIDIDPVAPEVTPLCRDLDRKITVACCFRDRHIDLVLARPHLAFVSNDSRLAVDPHIKGGSTSGYGTDGQSGFAGTGVANPSPVAYIATVSPGLAGREALPGQTNDCAISEHGSRIVPIAVEAAEQAGSNFTCRNGDAIGCLRWMS